MSRRGVKESLYDVEEEPKKSARESSVPKCPYCQRRHRKTDAPCTERAAEARKKARKQKAAAERIGKVAPHRKVWRVLLETTSLGAEPVEHWWDNQASAYEYARLYANQDRVRVVEVTRYVVKRGLKGSMLLRCLLMRSGWCESAVTIPENEWRHGLRRNGAYKVRT